MQYYSLTDRGIRATFKEALIAGIAPDRGLYFPEEIKALPADFFRDIESLSSVEIALAAIQQFVGEELPAAVLEDIVGRTLDFEFPVVEVGQDVASLELFQGPPVAVKDVGARFVAQCLVRFRQGGY